MCMQVEVKDKKTWEYTTKETVKEVNNEYVIKKEEKKCRQQQQGGCFSWIRKKSQGEKDRQRRDNIFFSHFKVC